MLKLSLKSFDLISKFSSITLNSSSQKAISSFTATNHYHVRMFSDVSVGDGSKATLPPPPKRSMNSFAMFVQELFKKMPAEMNTKEKFVKASEQWRQLSSEQKNEYKKVVQERFVQYKKEFDQYLKSLTPQQVELLKQLKKDRVKSVTRSRIKVKLRQLQYPKRACSAYIFYIRSILEKTYPDGKYPPVKTPSHLNLIKECSQNWKNLSAAERAPFEERSEADRKRFFEELEQWKHELAKPENEEDFLQLERLSKKIQVANLNEEKFGKRQKRQRRLAAKIIKKRLKKKASDLLKTKTKTLAKKKKVTKVKRSASSKNKVKNQEIKS